MPATGRLGVMFSGLGAVSTTLIAGVEAIRLNLAEPVGSLAQMGRICLKDQAADRSPLIQKFVPLSDLESLRFGAWDIFLDNAFEAAAKAKVLDGDLLTRVRPALERVKPYPAVFDPTFINRIDGPNTKKGPNKRDLAEQLRVDMRNFKRENNCERLVVLWCASTERYSQPTECHQSIARFEKGLLENDPSIAPSQIYAYAAIQEGIPFANGSPSLCLELPAIRDLACEMRVPIAGSDFKTGQTLLKTALAPAIKARLLGLSGWYSANILGNRDAEVLVDPGSFRSKEVSKLGVLNQILEPDTYPSLYGKVHHQVTVNYYPPRGDNKESWDNIDLFGWLGYPMQIKVNFLARDSILAAPIVLDLALFMDLAKRSDLRGAQEWLSFYFKSPLCNPGVKPEHDLMAQEQRLHAMLRLLGDQSQS